MALPLLVLYEVLIWLVNQGQVMQVRISADHNDVFDEQGAIRIQDLLNGLDGIDGACKLVPADREAPCGRADWVEPDGVTFVEPRRYFVGARLRF